MTNEKYHDSNGVELKDGDYVLSTGDGIAAFPVPHWSVGIFRIFQNNGETHYNIRPITPEPDGEMEVHFPARNDRGQFARLYKIDRESAISLHQPEKADQVYDEALNDYRRRKATKS